MGLGESGVLIMRVVVGDADSGGSFGEIGEFEWVMFLFGHLFEKGYKIVKHGSVLNNMKRSNVVSKGFLLDVFFDFFG